MNGWKEVTYGEYSYSRLDYNSYSKTLDDELVEEKTVNKWYSTVE